MANNVKTRKKNMKIAFRGSNPMALRHQCSKPPLDHASIFCNFNGAVVRIAPHKYTQHMRHVHRIYLESFYIFRKCVCIAYSMSHANHTYAHTHIYTANYKNSISFSSKLIRRFAIRVCFACFILRHFTRRMSGFSVLRPHLFSLTFSCSFSYLLMLTNFWSTRQQPVTYQLPETKSKYNSDAKCVRDSIEMKENQT